MNADKDSNINLNIKVPKKRGRKPKNSIEKLLKVEEEVKVPKKRGRKPKNYKKPEDTEVKVPKKRGRKTMLSQVTATNKNLNDNFLTKDNVLHLKISSNDINNNILLDSLYQYNPDIKEPQPYDPNNLYSESIMKENEEETDIETKLDNNNYNIDKKKGIISEITTNTEVNEVINEDDNEVEIDYQDILKNENVNIDNNLGKEIDTTKTNKNYSKKNVNAIMVYYNEYNKRKEWPKKSSINCFWCCHTFSNTPCALPTKFKGDVFHVYGNFCSKECAAAYNFSSCDNNNTNNVWERYSMLNYLYSLIECDPDLKIKLAPHRMTLEMFGGNLSIEEFRSSFQSNKNYNVNFPPMISVIPAVEQNNKSENNKRNDAYYIPIDKERIKKVNNDLRLKRKNPINNKNTLENCMRLKYS